MKKRIVVCTLFWLSAWCLAWGGFYLLLARNINYISRPVLTALYFTAATVLCASLGRRLITFRCDLLRPRILLVPGLIGLLGIAVYVGFPLLFSPPRKLIFQNPDMYFLHFSLRYFFSKLFDIAFQQTLVLLLVASLAREGLSLKAVCLLCCLIFGVPHLYLLSHNGVVFGGYFLVFSLLAGLVFPCIIMRFRQGPVYAFSLHLLFYIFTSAGCWLWPEALMS